MQTQTTEAAVLPQSAATANEEFLPRQNGVVSRSWDAYEVWRVRIKAVYDARRSAPPVSGMPFDA